MGACSAAFDRQSQKQKGARIDDLPLGTESLKHITLPILAFYILISDIKIKKCSYSMISLKFKVEGIDQFETPFRQIDRYSKAYWKINHIFECYLTEYQLRTKFLIIEVFDPHKNVLGNLKMNLFSIWTGPYHLDFKIELQKSKNCRISFNFKISQGIDTKLENIETQMIPNETKFYEDKFTFTLQTIIGQQIQQITSPYIVVIKPNIKQKTQEQNDQMDVVFVTNDKIIWSKEACLNNPLPKFDKKIAFYEFYSSNIHLVFYKVLPGLLDQNQVRYQIDSQCFISLTKLMTVDYVIYKDPVTNISYYERNIELLEKTWRHSKQTGKVRIKFKFLMQAHLKQMQACVRTQNGILTSTPVFSEGANEHSCTQIEELKKLNVEVQKQFINLDRNTYRQNNVIMTKQNILRISNLLAKQLALLEKTSKESLLFYSYHNEMQLLKAQRFLIDFGFKVVAFIHQDNPQICAISWKILTIILKRGQFKLSHLCFSKQQRDNIQGKNINDKLKLKIEVALKYQQLLNVLLRQTLSILYYKGEEDQKIFAQSFCSYAYFRIPLFRQHILTIIKRENDPQILEWRGTQININMQETQIPSSTEIDDFYEILFDWENNFYKPIANEQKYKLSKNQLKSILLEDRWKLRLSKRSGAFFTFLENLVLQIQYVSVVSKHIKWYRMPGYSRLLHAFLVEMGQQKIKNYSERFKKTCSRLLTNQKLLNVFVVIMLKKTNINDPQGVQKTIEMVDSFFKTIKRNNRAIPGTFDYAFFLQGLKMVLNGEIQYCISRALILIYDNLGTFSNQFRLQLSLYLLSNLFFRLYFHWSYSLRQIFHRLIYAKVIRGQQIKGISGSPQKVKSENQYGISIKAAIISRYDLLMGIIQKQVGPQLEAKAKDLNQQTNLFKKMRSKLKNKKNQHKEKIPEAGFNISLCLPNLRINKSANTGGTPLKTNKFLYFKEEELALNFPKREFPYIKGAIYEYRSMKQELDKIFEDNPSYEPQLKLKKMTDEKQLGPIFADQW